MDVLAIAPHPDDDIIGAGASLAKHSRRGHSVATVHVIGREVAAGDPTDERGYLAEVEQANATVGIQDYVRLRGRSRDFLVDRELRLELISAIRRVSPKIVYLPHADEADVEHRQVHELAVDCLWMAASPFFDEAGEPVAMPELVLGYEVWTPIRRHQYVEDVTDTIELKEQAMRHYVSQLRLADWPAAVRGLAAYRAATTLGHGYAEVFEVLHLGSPSATALAHLGH